MVQRQRVQTRLAAVQLIEGDPRGAKLALDSLVTEELARPSCPMPETMRWRGEAARRLGLIDEARADLAYVVVTGDWRVQVLSDSAPVLLGASYTKAAWDSALVAADAFRRKCWVSPPHAGRSKGG